MRTPLSQPRPLPPGTAVFARWNRGPRQYAGTVVSCDPKGEVFAIQYRDGLFESGVR